MGGAVYYPNSELQVSRGGGGEATQRSGLRVYQEKGSVN